MSRSSRTSTCKKDLKDYGAEHMPLLSVQGLGKLIGDRYLFRDLSFTLDEGEILCLSAPSGYGKTTVLKVSQIPIVRKVID